MSPTPGDNPLSKKDIRALAGRSIICGFEGTSVSAELREILREVRPLGLILFARNIESPHQVSELARELKSLRKDEPLLLSVDQEGGRVQRVRAPATVWPTMRSVGALDDLGLTERVARGLAREVRAMNFDLDYAPVLDVDTNPQNPVIGDRAFSSTASQVRRHGVAFIRAMQAEGVAACGKHFPGHGDTDKDSHLDLPRVEHELGRLRDVEWPPFAGAVEANVAAIMTAHVVVAALDETLPATLAPKALAPLRRELGYDGVIISDDLEMKAVADHFTVSEMAEKGLRAGCDVFLSCKRYEVTLELFRGLCSAVEGGAVSQRTLIEAGRRASTLRERYYQPATRWEDAGHLVGCSEHLDLVAEIEARLTAGA